jgi:FlaA1/EpsC-like NDP-sugar epimerase
MHRQLKNPNFYVMIFSDAAIFALSLTAAYLFRFELALLKYDLRQIYYLLLWVVPVKLSIFFVFGLYRGMWRYTGVRDFWKLAQACVGSVSYTHKTQPTN